MISNKYIEPVVVRVAPRKWIRMAQVISGHQEIAKQPLIPNALVSWMAINDAGFIEVVGRHFHIDLVTHGNADEIFSHFAGNMGQDLVPVGQCDAEHRTGQHLGDIPGQLNWFFFRHNVIEAYNVAIPKPKINFFRLKNDWTFGIVPVNCRPP